jgi:Flp pilus assembly pilin Flp
MRFSDLVEALRRAHRDDSGATAVEYGLMASLITVAIAGTVFTFGQAVVGMFAALSPTL